MALDTDEQELADVALAALPDWFRSDARAQEDVGMLAREVGAAYKQVKSWSAALLPSGATDGDPDWLNAHAIDRGTSRQHELGVRENDATLRARLQRVPDALTVSVIREAADAIRQVEGVAGSVEISELPRDGATLQERFQTADTGGEFGTLSGDTKWFRPYNPPSHAVCHQSSEATGMSGQEAIKVKSGRVVQFRLVVSGASNAGNNGTFTINRYAIPRDVGDGGDGSSFTGNELVFVNPTGVDGDDATVDWKIGRVNQNGAVIDNRPAAFLNRGHRLSALRSVIVVMLPYGMTAQGELAVREVVRLVKAAGFGFIVERRTAPP